MTDFTLFDRAIKLCCVKHLCSTEHSPWKIILISLPFTCWWYSSLSLPRFAPYLLQKYNRTQERTYVQNNQEVLNQIVWNDRFIKINKASVFYQNWNNFGVQHLSCLMSISENSFLSFNSFQLKLHVKCNFLQHYGLLSAIPRRWKNLPAVQESQETPTSFTFDKLSRKALCKSA